MARDGIPSLVDDVDTKPMTGHRPILVVDDVGANRIAMEVALSPLKREVVVASSGQQALAHLLERDFSLVLLDVQMPDMDGFETASLIRARPRTKHLPIIFVTAHHNDHAGVRRAYQLGAVDFLFKPLEPEILLAKCAVFVTLQDQAEELATERLRRDFEEARRNYETQALRRQNAALAETDRRKDSFLAILAHELRNPLAPIRTAIELLKAEPAKPQPRVVEILDRQSMQLAKLVDDLLDVGRIKTNKIELRRERLDLRELIETALTTSAPVITARRHALTTKLAEAPIMVSVDPVRVLQIFTNLLNNAARYTDEGGAIDLVCSVDEGHAIVTVSDTGIGIAAELIESIFEMFVQERVRSDGSGGLGLGLALARQLVELHGGVIRATSPGRGQGSRFEVRIPVDVAATRPATARELHDTQETGRILRIVIIDDNSDARELLSELLVAHGHVVAHAADGPTGLAAIRDQRPDVALIDLSLPGMDGVTLARTLRTEIPDLRTRMIAITGYGSAVDHERTRAAGFDAHLVKPATAAALFESISARAT